MHIFSLCALGSSCCFHPWSNLSTEGRTEKVNIRHSVPAGLVETRARWWMDSFHFTFCWLCLRLLWPSSVCENAYMQFCKATRFWVQFVFLDLTVTWQFEWHNTLFNHIMQFIYNFVKFLQPAHLKVYNSNDVILGGLLALENSTGAGRPVQYL